MTAASTDPDLALLAAWRGGDASAGQTLFQRHFDGIYRFFRHKCPDAADDLSQRTFLECVKSTTGFRAQASFRTYLYAIARHELLHHLRSLKAAPVDFEVSSIAEIVTTPASRLARAQEADRLRDALATLPAEQQLLLELHYWHDLDAPALAEVLAVEPTTVRTRLFRARQALRQRLIEAHGTAQLPGDDRLSSSLSLPEPGLSAE